MCLAYSCSSLRGKENSGGGEREREEKRGETQEQQPTPLRHHVDVGVYCGLL